MRGKNESLLIEDVMCALVSLMTWSKGVSVTAFHVAVWDSIHVNKTKLLDDWNNVALTLIWMYNPS